MSPADLRQLGVEPGDLIRVATRRGAIEFKARADGDVPPGMVFIPFCYAEAAANMLTNPQLDPFGKIPEFKFCAARVEKVERRPPNSGYAVLAFAAPIALLTRRV